MNEIKIIDERMHDRSRHFVYLPKSVAPISRVLKNYFRAMSMKTTSLQNGLQAEISGQSISGLPLVEAFLSSSKRFSAAC